MKKNKDQKRQSAFEHFASKMTHLTGSTGAFILAFMTIIVWLVTGPVFNYSDTWQLVINTGTTIVTFLMVFLIQKTQNKDGLAIQLKLNELVASNERASNRLISVEELTEEELIILSKFYSKLATMAKKEENLHMSHSIEEAEDKHHEKISKIKKTSRKKTD